MPEPNKYAVRGRLEYLEKVAGELRQDVTSLQTKPTVIGPAGKDGRNGSDCQCRNGRDGAKGPKGDPGVGAQGLPGASVKGDRGERGPSGPDTAEALAEARAVIASCRTELAALTITVRGLLDANGRSAEYVAWLHERVKARARERT